MGDSGNSRHNVYLDFIWDQIILCLARSVASIVLYTIYYISRKNVADSGDRPTYYDKSINFVIEIMIFGFGRLIVTMVLYFIVWVYDTFWVNRRVNEVKPEQEKRKYKKYNEVKPELPEQEKRKYKKYKKKNKKDRRH